MGSSGMLSLTANTVCMAEISFGNSNYNNILSDEDKHACIILT